MRSFTPTHCTWHLSHLIYEQGSVRIGDKRQVSGLEVKYPVICLHNVTESVRAHVSWVLQQWWKYTKNSLITLVWLIEHKN